MGLLDSLEDDKTPNEAQHDATHEGHLYSMRKFAQDKQLAARRRPIFIYLKSFNTAAAAQSERLGEWLIIFLKKAGTSSNNMAFPRCTLKSDGTKLVSSL